ncbi:acyltransferase family protein [Streptomyces griseofuscus]|uniref:acyltransferase family protein n=1 Tax=Streptomyces TaxID=1883 RepID=UPI0018F0E885|nr:acyltransferase [Streptomyces sp. CRPSP2-6A1]MBJ7003042.1 acyltransferase [Streptomyces sp. CRPSP2-6A1]
MTTPPSPALDDVPIPTPEGTAAPAPAERRSRLLALDGLRLVAALMVCLYHYTGRGGTISESWHQSPSVVFPTLSRAAVYGCFGVQLFFVISGFVICMSSWGRTLGDFFRSRVSRLYPAYWVALALVTAASLVLPAVIAPVRLDEFLVNLTMLQQPMGATRVLGVCWTLWAEVRFYALFALFVVVRGVTYRRVVLFCSVWVLALVLCRTTGNALTDQVLMPEYAPFFIGGLALYLIHRFGSDLLLWGIVAVALLLGQSEATRGLWHRTGHSDLHRDPYVVVLIVTLSFAVVAAVALGWTRWASWRWLTTAGALTYPFYLVHEHLGWFVIRILHRFLGLPSAATLAATVLTMLTLAWLIHRFVEKPFGPRLRKALRGRNLSGRSPRIGF